MTMIPEEQLPRLVESIRKRYEDTELGALQAHGYFAKGKRKTGKLHDVIALRRAHFHNRPEVDPILPKPYDEGPAIQSDVPRMKHGELKARICENPFKITAEAKDTTYVKREAANAVEAYVLAGLNEIEERNGYTFQEGMSDAQIIDGVGFIHWREAYEKVPEWPGYEYRDTVAGEDDEVKKRFKRSRDYVEGSAEEKSRRLRETDDSLHDRRRKALAEAPFPYEAEVLSGRNISWVPDRACKNGFGIVVWTRAVGWLDWSEDYERRGMKDSDGKALKAMLGKRESGEDGILFMERDAPFPEGPSADGWEATVNVCEVWTREHWYELVSLGHGTGIQGSWTFVASGEHEWGMPPFAIVTGIGTVDPDPVLAFQPALAGVFRLKPAFDEAITLMHTLARNIAMPWFYLQPQAQSGMPPILNEDGSMKAFSWDSAAGMKIPTGYELKWVDPQLNAAYPQSISLMREMYQESWPSTGTTDTSASSQPWTVRLKQQEANVTPRMLITKQLSPLDIMASSIAEDCARKALDEPDESLWAYQEDEGKRKLVGVPASAFKGLKIHVDIDATSAAERVTEAQLGMAMLEAGMITLYQFWDEFWGDPDPQKRIDEVDAQKAFDMYWLPGIIRQEMARIQGTEIIVGVDGQFAGANGQEMAPDEVLGSAGVKPATPPQVMGQGPSQPGMGTLAPDGAVPIQSGIS